jgi:hypothetical protein
MRTINRTGLETYFITMRKEYERESQLPKKRGREEETSRKLQEWRWGSTTEGALNSELSPCPTQTLIP